MAITSANPISFKTKEGASEPQQAFDVTIKKPHMTDVDGNVTSWSYQRFVGDLHTKTLIVEGRGYHASNLPVFGSTVVTKGWLITDSSGEVATEGSFYAKTVVVEGHRINEVGMWRVTKIVTIKVLYVNGQKATDKNGVVGVETFGAEDYKI